MKNTFLKLTFTKFSLSLQRILSYFLLIFLYPFFFILLYSKYRYRIIELKSIRKEFKKLSSQINGPLLICSNHLTFIDPIIIIWALGSFWYYLFHYNRFIWNFPSNRYSKKHWLFKLIFFIGKCIPVHRNEYNRKIKHTMKKMIYLLSRKETLLIFPEGKRSVTGRIDNQKFTKGVGRLLKEINHLPVLCIYLRGESNMNCDFPKKGEKFHLALKLMYPESNNQGSGEVVAYSNQIMNSLRLMEEKFLLQTPGYDNF
jgi:1-acyl-sn-glycerol-3-phosphate acyltransferase